MADTSIIIDELRERVRRFVEMARRIGVTPEELAREALGRFPAPELGAKGDHLLAERVDTLAGSMKLPREVVKAAIMLPPGRAEAFEAVEATAAFRNRLKNKYGQFSSSLPLIREDRERQDG
ncbi:MAG: hypothetical protein ACOCX2_07595 [Armatimonadota bacterium]